MDEQQPAGPAGPAFGDPPPPPGPATATATHMAPGRRRSRGLLALGALLVVAVGGAAAAVLLSGGGGDDDDGQGVVLLAAASPGRDDFAGDLDLLEPDQRAQPGGVRVRLPSTDLEEPVALAGLGIRGAEPGLYTATRDEPTCDVDQLGELLLAEGGAEPDPTAVAWFAAIARNIDESEHEDYLDDLTAVRLRLDTRVEAHGFVDGAAVPYPAVLQAGTAVLVDQMGVPRVRCTGGTPLGETDPAGLSRDAALDVDARAGNPDDAWAGFDPAAVVVVEARMADEGFEVASATGPDDDGDETFLRATGSNGDRDRGVFTPSDGEPAEGCGEQCHELEITIAAAGGTPVAMTFEGVADPTEVDDQRLYWREAGPTTYKYTVRRESEVYRTIGPDDDVEAIMAAFYADPASEGGLTIMPDPVAGLTQLLRCADGPATVTVTVDDQVAETREEDVSCTGTVELEFVLE